MDYSINFWTEGVFSTALGIFGIAGTAADYRDG
jgi:hypothetical protein